MWVVHDRRLHERSPGATQLERRLDRGTPTANCEVATTAENDKEHTFNPQMFPTILSSSSADTLETSVSSFNPRSLARCNRQMKQKLVLMSANLS